MRWLLVMLFGIVPSVSTAADTHPIGASREIEVAGTTLKLGFSAEPSRVAEHLTSITVDVHREDRRIQTLRVDSMSDLEHVLRLLWTDDADFDGNPDLGIVDKFGGKWHGYRFFLFDPGSGRFVENDLSRELGKTLGANGYTVDAETRTITQHFLTASCLGERRSYRIENDRLVLYEEVVCERSESGGSNLLKTLRREDGEMRVVAISIQPRTGQ